MNEHPLPFEPDPEARAARRIAVAHRQVEMALEIAEAVQRLAMARIERDIAAAEAGEAAPADDAGAKGRRDDPVAAVERAGRAVRLSLALAARLDSDEPVRRARVRSDTAAERQAMAEARDRERQADSAAAWDETFQLQDKAIEVVTQGLLRAGLDEVELHERTDEARERLGEDEWEFDLDERHFGAVIASLFEALEFKPDWSIWASEPWAVEEAQINALGSPYATGGAAWVAREGGEDPPDQAVNREPVAADGSSP